jgi:formate-dependent phosphoribosylglycinamide formyltransferase (GAR transformylase)
MGSNAARRLAMCKWMEIIAPADADGVEAVIFSEVSPRPHDTGLVTLGSQPMSEFALHARAILGLPVAAAPTVEEARLRAREMAALIQIELR